MVQQEIANQVKVDPALNHKVQNQGEDFVVEEEDLRREAQYQRLSVKEKITTKIVTRKITMKITLK